MDGPAPDSNAAARYVSAERVEHIVEVMEKRYGKSDRIRVMDEWHVVIPQLVEEKQHTATRLTCIKCCLHQHH